jgi:phosphatidate phosphatase PAH1
MRILFTLLIFMLCSGCWLKSTEIESPPPKQTQAVVFDIDGTLTPDVFSFKTVRPDAAKAAQLYAKKGYKIFYISARSILAQSMIPDWLKKNGFPDGNIQVPKPNEELMNDEKFKIQIMDQLKKEGWKLDYAYGDSPIDFDAYAAEKIPQEHVFALQRNSEKECLKGVKGGWAECLKEGWTPHLDYIKNSVKPVIVQ